MSSRSAQSLRPENPGRSPSNRSLERGIEILRSFRPGSELLGNAELAERTGLSRSTVSRLAQTLVGMGYLQVEPRTRAYSLAPAVLSLAHAMRSGSTALAIAAPHMRAASQGERINVGLAAPDRDEMVYLESIRYNRRPSLRTVVSGQRVPMELTSLGRAYLASAPEGRRKALLAHFRRLRRAQWTQLGPALSEAIRAVEEQGYCAAAWQPEVVAVATPLAFKGSHYALNVSLSTAEPFAQMVRELAPVLLALKARIQRGLDAATD
ncbi:IclR family transcriptional regulator [Variovorax sp. J22R24]|uniref:IclR family transcriptional regulator n=1 Tax=Variovorax gracilis TaxID=3053502 RepID=UPI002578D16D|nr:IclR family transcriptional regulator [Variovorax sp. J22R24]MDM0107166.1 IclR family transcriptional regulator [Variovorax sp. J22R24]